MERDIYIHGYDVVYVDLIKFSYNDTLNFINI